MQVIEPSWEIWDRKINTDIYRKIEDAARICYKSETNSENASIGKLTAKLVKSGHEAMLNMTVCLPSSFATEQFLTS